MRVGWCLPLVVALTGTDLYGDIHTSPEAQTSLDLATRLVVLQPMGIRELPERCWKDRKACRSVGSILRRWGSLLGG